MSSFAVFREIGDTLESLITGEWEISTPKKPSISFDSPCKVKKDETNPNSLSIYLYQITENTHLKNAEGRITQDGKKIRDPSLALDLLYLVTPLGETSQNDLLILGRVMQIFHDNPVIPDKYFPTNGSLKAIDEIKILLYPLSLDDLTKIWNAFQEAPYRLSVGYMVTPVLIDSTKEAAIAQRVIDKESIHGYVKKLEK
jgi:hypothetical protein